MELEEESSTNKIKNDFQICSDNNLDYFYYCCLFSRDCYSNNAEFIHAALCKSILFISGTEKQDTPQENHTLMIMQVNRTELITPPPWIWDKREKNNTLNSLSIVSSYFKYCVNVYRLLIFKKYTFYIKDHFYTKNVTLSQQSDFCISVDNLQTIMMLQDPENKNNLFYYRKKQYLCNGDSKEINCLNSNETCLLYNHTQRNALDIRLEQQGIDFWISLSKYSIPHIFYTLIKGCKLCSQLIPDAASVKMFSLSVGNNWYFQNASQGYLLKLLLRNVNVSTLSVMMQLYFILITHVHPNLTIQINYRKKPELLTIHESFMLKIFSLKSMEWRRDHKVILRSTILHIDNDYYEERSQMKLLCAIPYENTEPTQIESLIQVVDYEDHSQTEDEDNSLQPVPRSENREYIIPSTTQSEEEALISSPLSLNEYANNTLQSELHIESEILHRPAPYKKYSDIFRLDNISNSKETSLTSSIENLFILHKEPEELKKSDMFNIFFSYGVSNFSYMQSKLCVTELRQRLDALKMFIKPQDIFDANLISESMFDGTTVNLYEKYCKPLLNQKFVVITLHNLGKSLGNILFNIN